MQPTMKSPKSPKGTIIENPLMKNFQFSNGGSALTTHRTSSALQAMPRSPLLAMTPNRDNLRHQQLKTKTSQIADTPGPPPTTSLSLMGGMGMPMQTNRSIASNEPQMKQQETRFDTLKTPAMVSTPIPVASPRLLEKKSKTESYFRESTSNFSSVSLVADHWVVAHGYTSHHEYEELLSILSSYGTIVKQDAGGNWLAVLYESKFSAEKAIDRQTIILSNTLCGIISGSPSLLQKLSSSRVETKQQEVLIGEDKSREMSRNDSRGDEIGRGNVNEMDILMLENSAYESREKYKPKSLCDKVFAWYFEWEDHPHSE